MTTKRHFFAWSWEPYGVTTDGQSGRPIGRLHRFPSRKARDEWTRAGAGIPRTQAGHREPCPASWQRFDSEPVEHGEGGNPCA